MATVALNPNVSGRNGSMGVWIWWPSIDYIAFEADYTLDDLNFWM
jgi:hypothetical protein